jgi:signal transduction histidine kinase
MGLGPALQRSAQNEMLAERPLANSRPEVGADNSCHPALMLLRLLIHELSQPITALLGEVELALMAPPGQQELRTTFERCLRSLESVRKVVTEFRLAGEMNETSLVTLPLVRLINRVLETHKPAAARRGCTIKWHAPREVWVISDLEVLEACLSKILIKVIDACPREGMIDVELIPGSELISLELFCSRREAGRAFASAAPQTDSEWMLPARIIQLLGGSLQIRHDLDFQVSVRITLSPRPQALVRQVLQRAG